MEKLSKVLLLTILGAFLAAIFPVTDNIALAKVTTVKSNISLSKASKGTNTATANKKTENVKTDKDNINEQKKQDNNKSTSHPALTFLGGMVAGDAVSTILSSSFLNDGILHHAFTVCMILLSIFFFINLIKPSPKNNSLFKFNIKGFKIRRDKTKPIDYKKLKLW